MGDDIFLLISSIDVCIFMLFFFKEFYKFWYIKLFKLIK